MNRLSKLLLISFLSCQVLACIVQGATHYYDFVLTESNFTRLCNTTSILTVNESLPGPVIRINKGDTVYVNAYNQGSYGITLHCLNGGHIVKPKQIHLQERDGTRNE
ncbi:hypothetical protein Droror1_Dr00018019 [Drosera rotundifolia]